jgi:hypothetical protein
MNKLKIILFLILFVFLNNAFAELNWEEKKSEITKISYVWNLSEDTEISIEWKEMLNCADLKIEWNPIKIYSKSDTKITYLFKTNKIVSWKISLICNWEEIKSRINFPFINKTNGIKTKDFDRNIYIYTEGIYEKREM